MEKERILLPAVAECPITSDKSTRGHERLADNSAGFWIPVSLIIPLETTRCCDLIRGRLSSIIAG